MDIAKKNGVMVSLDLSDANIVRNNKEEIKEIIKKYVDIVFANEDEAYALTGEDPLDAVDIIKETCTIAIVKMGKEGSVLETDEEVLTIGAYPTTEIDTTGAGDSYAAAVLYGIARNIPLRNAANLGSYIASQVVSQIGARLETIDTEMVGKILAE